MKLLFQNLFNNSKEVFYLYLFRCRFIIIYVSAFILVRSCKQKMRMVNLWFVLKSTSRLRINGLHDAPIKTLIIWFVDSRIWFSSVIYVSLQRHVEKKSCCSEEWDDIHVRFVRCAILFKKLSWKPDSSHSFLAIQMSA